jgi:hypothetical protein
MTNFSITKLIHYPNPIKESLKTQIAQEKLREMKANNEIKEEIAKIIPNAAQIEIERTFGCKDNLGAGVDLSNGLGELTKSKQVLLHEKIRIITKESDTKGNEIDIKM